MSDGGERTRTTLATSSTAVHPMVTLLAVVRHYNQVLSLRMTDAEMSDLAEYLKSL